MSSFVFTHTKDGSQPVTKQCLIADVNVTAGVVCYYTSGMIDDAQVGSAFIGSLAGVSEETVDNATTPEVGKTIAVQTNPQAVYRVYTNATMATGYVGTDVTLETLSDINENDVETGGGTLSVIHIEKYVSSTEAEVSLNFYSRA